jgi:hypothetical protein
VLADLIARDVGLEASGSVENRDIPIDVEAGLLRRLRDVSDRGNLLLNISAAIGWGELGPNAEPEQALVVEEEGTDDDEDEQ